MSENLLYRVHDCVMVVSISICSHGRIHAAYTLPSLQLVHYSCKTGVYQLTKVQLETC